MSEHNFDRQQLSEWLVALQPRQDIIDRISKPAEKVWTWGRYQKHLVDDARIEAGLEFWDRHEQTLSRAEQELGVAVPVIVAILGVETRYGQITGSFPVLESLYTLGFHYPPRAKFFRKELTEYLLLTREEKKDPRDIKGSYAGAMGYGQFIPSSYRHYAIDFDGDELRDIWTNPVDAIGSIANYFKRHRWRGKQPVALQVRVAPQRGINFDNSLKLNSTIGELIDAGILIDDSEVAAQRDLSAKVFRVEGREGIEHWLALHDFYVITRYNHSHLYALAVHHLAEALRSARKQGLADEYSNEYSNDSEGSRNTDI